MSGFSSQVMIAGSVDEVWEELSDIGNIYEWNPGVQESHLTSEISQGVGASRHCDLEDGNYLDEDVIEWDPSRVLTIRTARTSLPLQRADIRFTLQEIEEGTTVRIISDYELKYGLLGKLLDALFVRRKFSRAMDTLLAGLKEQVEAGQPQSLSLNRA